MRFRLGRVIHVALAFGLVMAAGTVTAHATASSAASMVSYVETPDLPVVSSTGRDLNLGIFSYPGDGSELEVDVSDVAGEDHLWELPLKKHSFRYDPPLVRGQSRPATP